MFMILKKKLAVIISVCMFMTNIMPAFATPVTESVKIDDQQIAEALTEVESTIKEATASEAEYNLATPSDAECTDSKELKNDLEDVFLEEATPSNAKREGEVLIRESTVDGIKITLTADPGVFPEDTELWAEKVEDESAEEAIEAAVEKERDSSVNVASSYKFDIKMLLYGEEIQPDTDKGSVKVTFTMEEKLGDCLTANAYHLKEDTDGELTAENLEAEVKTVEAAAMESATEDALPVKEVLSDGIIESDAAVNAEVTEIEAEIPGFSYYVVEFTYNELQYILPGDSSVKLSEILKTLAIEGTVSEAEVSNEDLFTVIKDTEGDDWTVTALKAFSSKEWMKITLNGQVYEIIVTDDAAPLLLVEVTANGRRSDVRSGVSIDFSEVCESLGLVYHAPYLVTASVDTSKTDYPECITVSYKPEAGGSFCINGRFSGVATLKIELWWGMSPVSHEITMRCLDGETVEYIDENGEKKTADCTVITGIADYCFKAGLWYVVKGDVTMPNRINNIAPESDPSHLILADGSHLTAKGGINTENGKGLKIYAQSEGTGKLTITDVPDYSAGIGGVGSYGSGCGSIVISGGVISIDSAQHGAGIGSSDNSAAAYMHMVSGSVTINGGTITIHSNRGNSIGGGGTYGSRLETITINGGTLKLHGTIGGGIGYGAKTDVAISGGQLSVEGGIAAEGDISVSDNLNFYALNESGALIKMSVDEYKSHPTGYVAIGTEEGNYQVHYLLQKVDLSDYEETPDSPVICSGPVGTMTVAGKRHFDGFNDGKVTEQLITGEDGIELEVKYERASFRIDYYLNGHGSGAPNSEIHTYGEKITEPSKKPSADDYTFAGWYKELECENKFEFTTMPANSVNLYAKWVPINYTITWKDGNQILKQDSHIYGDIPNYGADPVKTGYEFVSWWPAIQKVTGDATYNAVFFKLEGAWHKVSFDSRGGTAIPFIDVYEGETVAAPTAPVREKYTFDGWYTDIGCTAAYDFATPVTKDLMLYAKWTENTKPKYTITWIIGDSIDITQVTEGEMPTHEDPSKEGYIFTGWTPALAPAAKAATYTAKFEQKTPEKAAVSFNTAGGSFIETQVVIKGHKASRPATDPVKSGYSFDGWYTDAGYGTAFDFEKSITSDTTVYAKWKILPATIYTVTWKLDDGSLINTTSVKTGDMPVHDNPVKDGYIFLGWNPAPAPVTGDITYTAKFEQHTPDKATVAFNTDGGSFVKTQIVLKGKTAVRPSDPEKGGYEFVNWYTDAGCSMLYDFNTLVTADITLYAKWKKTAGKEYTITFTDWDGKLLASLKVEEGGLPVYPKANPTRSGYIFTYWDSVITLATCDKTYKATYAKQSTGGGGGGGGGTVSTTVKAAPTFSPNWYSDIYGVWRIRNSAGQTVVNAWLCDDVIKANGQNVWYLIGTDGAMMAAGLVQDNTGNFYSLETEHNGYFGMLRYKNGIYNCNGQQVYLTFNQEHNGSFGAITNAEGLEKLKAIYGVTTYSIGNENAVYTATF